MTTEALRFGGDTETEEPAFRSAKAERAVLVIATPGGGRVAPLPEEGSLVLGRESTSGRPPEGDAGEAVLGLPDALLSRRHLKIDRAQRGYTALDLESRNGTFLDGRRLGGPVGLAEGSVLLFGNHVAVFRLVSRAELEALAADAAAPFGPAATLSPALALIYARLRKLARTDAELLLVGETGVGKEICARGVHRASGRRGPFLAINCASLPAALVESELFGYVAGAHSTATAAKPGMVEAAEGGTLLLDEIGDMPPELQAKLFRFLQDRMVRPLGSTRARRADVRVIAATTRIQIGPGPESLRADLVGRLGAEAIAIPTLRSRPEEVPSLITQFGGEALQKVEPAAFRAMCLYGWPLNVRELEKAVANALAMSTGGTLRLENLPPKVRDALRNGPVIEARRREPRGAPAKADLARLLEQHEGNVSSVARALDRQWNVVHRWLARYGLRAGRFRKGKG